MFGHTALAANFLILIALCLFAYREKYKGNIKKKVLLWGACLWLASTIHMYYIPMCLVIMLSTFIIEFIEDKKSYKSSIITFSVACIFALIIVYLLGGFTVGNYQKGGLDNYNANLDTFVNPQGFSRFLKEWNLATEGEYEGLGYLGIGIILMSVISIVYIASKYKIRDVIKNHNVIFVILCLSLGMGLAIGTSVKLGGYILFNIPYPQILLKLLNIFRASGRMVWIVCYVIFFASICTVGKVENKKLAYTIITACLIIQVLDLAPTISRRFEYQEIEYEYDKTAWEKMLDNHKHIMLINNLEFTVEDMFRLSYIANENDTTMSNFYFARDIESTKETDDKCFEDLSNGTLNDDYIYVFKRDSKDIPIKENLSYYYIDEYIVIVSKQISELTTNEISI